MIDQIRILGYLLLFSVLLPACKRTSTGTGPYKLTSHFADFTPPAAPDYNLPENWAALPDRHDMADSVPAKSGQRDQQAEAVADVFFVYPTTYTYQPKNVVSEWNGAVDDASLNKHTDETTILNQASIFNGAGRVYAPRYRQAHYHAFVTTNVDDKTKSLDLAYSDVKAAFEYYLANYNQGRPIIIAAHSQGTRHATRLIADFFDDKPLQKQLVVAYLIGIATPPNQFKTIPPGESATQTGCFVSWNTFARKFVPPYYKNGLNRALCTNPLTWSSAATYAPRSLNKGGVGRRYKFTERLSDAQVHEGLLWVRKPRITGAFLVSTKIWHIADLNFFWLNTRQNASDRLQAFLNKPATVK